jgi:RNA polymerase sigma factor (sigma-70 family)
LDRSDDRPETALSLSRVAADPGRTRASPRGGCGLLKSAEPHLDGPDRQDLLRRYLLEIGSIPVLEPDQEAELARTLRAARQELHGLLAQVPYTARALQQRWLSLRAQGRVSGQLSELHQAPGAGDRSPEVDRLLARIRRVLAQRDRLYERGERQGLERLDRRLERLVHAVAPRAEVFAAILAQLRAYGEVLDGPKSERQSASRRRGLESEIGISASQLRRRLRAAQAAETRARTAKSTFVYHNLRLVVHEAKNFRRMGVGFLDLIQEGNLGLMRAVDKFDERYGNRFSTYGVWWIQQSCIRAIQNASRTVRIPSHLFDGVRRYRNARESFERANRRRPTHAELGALLDLDQGKVETLIRIDAPTLSLDDPIPGTELTAGDRLASASASSADTSMDGRRLEKSLHKLLGSLTSRERQILQWRFGLGQEQDQTLQEIGNELGLSRERVREIEKGALTKLRKLALGEGLDALLD